MDDAAAVDYLARLIAVVGLGLSIVGTAVALLAYRRDRPKLNLRWQADPSVPELEVRIVNVGRQPMALAEVRVSDWRAPLWVRLWPLVRPFHWVIRRWRGNLSYGDVSIKFD